MNIVLRVDIWIHRQIDDSAREGDVFLDENNITWYVMDNNFNIRVSDKNVDIRAELTRSDHHDIHACQFWIGGKYSMQYIKLIHTCIGL